MRAEVLAQSLRERRRSLLWWSLGVLALVALTVAFYPSIENDDAINDYVKDLPESLRGAFRTPNLRGVADTAPYMHSGQFATLEEVIDFYNFGGGVPVTGTRDPLLVPLGLTADEGADLVAFLRTLSGEPVPAERLVDTSASP